MEINKKIEDDLIEELMFVIPKDPSYKDDIKKLEIRFNCKIKSSTEKHNVLQYTYFYEVDFNKKEMFYIEIESGIENGTQLNHAEWDFETKSDTKTIEVLKDIILDQDFYEKGSFYEKKAQAVLDFNKDKLFEFHRQNNYDNYVTGGNSKMKLDPLLSQLNLEYIYKYEEVDCYFI